MSEKIVEGNLDEVISRGDHGDRSGGLLIGYSGLITVPVAFITYWKINNSTTGNSRIN